MTEKEYIHNLAKIVYKYALEHQAERKDIELMTSEVLDEAAELALNDNNLELAAEFKIIVNKIKTNTLEYNDALIKKDDDANRRASMSTINYARNGISESYINNNYDDSNIDIDYDEIRNREVFKKR